MTPILVRGNFSRCIFVGSTTEEDMARKLQKDTLHGKAAPADLGLLGHPLSAKKLGYARVSTEEQDLSVQLTALEKAGCDRIYKEKISAVDARRDQLRLMRKQAEAGDTIIIHAYSRLSRNLGQLLEIVDDFKKRGIAIKSLTEPHIDPFTTSGRLVLSVTGAVDEHERGQVKDRTKRAMAQKKAEGMYIGRPVKVTPEVRKKIKAMRKEGKSAKFIAAKLKISTSAVYGVK